MLLKNDFFWISQGKVATVYRQDGQMYKLSMLNFIRNQHIKIIKIGLNFDRVIRKIKRWTFLAHSAYGCQSEKCLKPSHRYFIRYMSVLFPPAK